MSQEKWCEHITINQRGDCFIRYPDCVSSWGVDDRVNFCALCGAPRPKKKSLAEKFKDKFKLLDEYFDNACEELAKIAEEHYKGGK